MKITKSEYKLAKRIVSEYENQQKQNFKSEYTCICCKSNKISVLDDMTIFYDNPEQCSWDGGTVSKIAFGYGSRFDTSTFFAGICDNCIEILTKDGLVIPS